MGAGVKSYMWKGFLIYEEMRKYFNIYEEAISHISPCNRSFLNFLMENLNFLFYQCGGGGGNSGINHLTLPPPPPPSVDDLLCSAPDH
jgi:hypothetical protein